jgi:hypothetical protein
MHTVTILAAVGELGAKLGLSLRQRENLSGRFEFVSFCRSRIRLAATERPAIAGVLADA